MTGMFASAVTGCLGRSMAAGIVMTAILATGAALPLSPGPAAFSGLVAGVFAALQRPTSPRNRRVVGIILIACLLLVRRLGSI